MARAAANRTAEVPAPPKQVYGLTAQNKRRRELDDLGPILRITKADIITLRDLCAHEGSMAIATQMGLAEVTLLRVMAGLGERCIPRSTDTLREFLEKLNS